jgi:magnesium-transporting ATPase (P-type)
LSIHNAALWNAQQNVILLKGAPDVLLEKCSHYVGLSGEQLVIDASFTERYRSQYEEFGGNVSFGANFFLNRHTQGERVLGFAYSFMNIDDPTFDSKIKERLNRGEVLTYRIVLLVALMI